MGSKNKTTANVKNWRFFRAGGLDQVRLDTAADLMALEELDQKLWVALACPVNNVHFDKKTLSFIDTDNDTRVHARELINAIKWTGNLLKNPDLMIGQNQSIRIDDISDSSDEGKQLRGAALKVLKTLKKSPEDYLTIDEIQNSESLLIAEPFNGDGIIGESSTDEEQLKKCISTIIKVEGAITDRSRAPGITQEKVESFFNRAKACQIWLEEPVSLKTQVNDLSEKSIRAYLSIHDKISDYFNRCAVTLYNSLEKVFYSDTTALSGTDTVAGLLLAGDSKIENMPLSMSCDGLRPGSEINPFWSERFNEFMNSVAIPLVGNIAVIKVKEWEAIKTTMVPVIQWYQKNPLPGSTITDVESIATFADTSYKETIVGLIVRDQQESETINSLMALEKLVRYIRDLHPLTLNFVNFKDFYSGSTHGIFQAGTLYIDQRSCSLCIRIDDVGRHSSMAATAGTCLIYCDCRRKDGAEKQTIVAALTNGDSENIMVGRNGLFYDRNGNDWDATVIKIIDNPISLRQAFWLPYKSFVKMIETQVAKRATAAEAASTEKLSVLASSTTNIDKNAANKPAQTTSKVDVGAVAALGVAAGAIGTFVATLFGYVMGIVRLGPLAIIGALLGVLLLISGPSLVLAFIKLRKRNLGPILDAGGWAINAKTRINVPFGEMLTRMVSLPAGSRRDLIDPYAEKKNPWVRVIIIAALLYSTFAVLNTFGYIYKWSNGRVGKPHIAVTQEQSTSQK
jgi:hypothetical protein